MAERFTVVVASPEVDAVIGGALAGRAAAGAVEALVFDSQDLAGFFTPAVQRRLPRGFNLVLCGQSVVHCDWEGRLVRPRLMDALRSFLGPLRWFSAGPWDPEDRRAVAHVIGDGNLFVGDGTAPVAQLVRAHCGPAEDACADSLAQFAAGHSRRPDEAATGEAVRRILSAPKADRSRLAHAMGVLMAGEVERLVADHDAEARRVEQENRRLAAEQAGAVRMMGETKLVLLALPAERHPFWEEIGAFARREAGAPVSLCRLEGRPTLLLACDRSVRFDLRDWARYVTDLMPAAYSVGARPHVVPLVVEGLAEDAALSEEVLSLLAEGAHLLRG